MYASRHGSTRLIAERVGERLREKGFDVQVRPAGEKYSDLGDVGIVVVGGALYSGFWHRDARRFLRRHRAQLTGRAVAVFASGPRNDEPRSWDRSRRQLARALRGVAWLTPIAVTVFGGADPAGLKTNRDLRDWDAVEAWAAGLPALAGPPAGVQTGDQTGDQAVVQAGEQVARKTFRRGPGNRMENRVMRLPVRWGWLPGTYVLTTVGRRTGQRRTTMVTVVHRQGRLWLVAPYGTVGWVHNARAAGRVELTRRGRTQAYTVREVGAQEAGPVLKEYVHRARATRPYFAADPDDPVERFTRESASHPVFELTEAAG